MIFQSMIDRAIISIEYASISGLFFFIFFTNIGGLFFNFFGTNIGGLFLMASLRN